VIEAYFDESERQDGTFCVAGYYFFPREAKRLERKWRDILGDRIFHATDISNGGGKFRDLDKPTREKMYSELVKAVAKHAEFGSAASVNPSEVSVKWPDLDGFRTAYAVCCNHVITRACYHFDSQSVKSRIAYVFESGHKQASEANRYMDNMAKSESRAQRFHYLSHNFAGKRDVVLLQTADLLAYEWCKCQSETGFPVEREDAKRPIRESLGRLLFARPDRACVGHLNGESLDREFLIVEGVLRGVREGEYR